MADLIDRVSEVLDAARRRWRGYALTIWLGEREYDALQAEFASVLWMHGLPGDSAPHFRGCPIYRLDKPFGIVVWPMALVPR
jgi:hypothetical protein